MDTIKTYEELSAADKAAIAEELALQENAERIAQTDPCI